MPDSTSLPISEFSDIANAAKMLADEIHAAPTGQFGHKDVRLVEQQMNMRSLVCTKLLLTSLLAHAGAKYMAEQSSAAREKLATLLTRIENNTEDDTRYYRHLPFNENFMYLRAMRILNRATRHATDVLAGFWTEV
ncbi:MAG: hypothetical protein RIE87_11830 [Rhodospirillales bacterium]|jgi:hypothetical protein